MREYFLDFFNIFKCISNKWSMHLGAQTLLPEYYSSKIIGTVQLKWTEKMNKINNTIIIGVRRSLSAADVFYSADGMQTSVNRDMPCATSSLLKLYFVIAEAATRSMNR